MHAWRIALTAALMVAASAAMAQDRTQGRSMVISQYGIVAAEHPIAARAGTAMLESGGNAIDAAVATNAVMGLVAPMMNGIGGDLFAIVYDAKTGKLYGLNASRLGADGAHRRIPRHQRRIATMPYSRHPLGDGARRGRRLGCDAARASARKSFADVLAPAIAHAEDGFPVSEVFGDDWGDSADNLLQATPRRRRSSCRTAARPRSAKIFRNPDLAGFARRDRARTAATPSTRARSRSAFSRPRRGSAAP